MSISFWFVWRRTIWLIETVRFFDTWAKTANQSWTDVMNPAVAVFLPHLLMWSSILCDDIYWFSSSALVLSLIASSGTGRWTPLCSSNLSAFDRLQELLFCTYKMGCKTASCLHLNGGRACSTICTTCLGGLVCALDSKECNSSRLYKGHELWNWLFIFYILYLLCAK